MPDPKFISKYTGQDVESALAKALQLDTFEYICDEVIDGNVYHVVWKVKPTSTNTVYGVAYHPVTGKLTSVVSLNGNISLSDYVTTEDAISTSELDNLF